MEALCVPNDMSFPLALFFLLETYTGITKTHPNIPRYVCIFLYEHLYIK